MQSKLQVALIAAIASLFGTLIGACASIATSKMHLDSERARMQVHSLAADRRTHQEKAEAFFGEVAGLISFFEANLSYERQQALSHIANVRRAAFEIAPYSSPEMAYKTISAVDRVRSAIDAANAEQVHSELEAMKVGMREMIKAFYDERRAYVQEERLLLNSASTLSNAFNLADGSDGLRLCKHWVQVNNDQRRNPVSVSPLRNMP